MYGLSSYGTLMAATAERISGTQYSIWRPPEGWMRNTLGNISRLWRIHSRWVRTNVSLYRCDKNGVWRYTAVGSLYFWSSPVSPNSCKFDWFSSCFMYYLLLSLLSSPHQNSVIFFSGFKKWLRPPPATLWHYGNLGRQLAGIRFQRDWQKMMG